MGRIPPLPFMCVEGRGGDHNAVMAKHSRIGPFPPCSRVDVSKHLFSRSSVMDIGTHGHCGICHDLNCCTRSCFWDILGDRPSTNRGIKVTNFQSVLLSLGERVMVSIRSKSH